MQLIAQSPPGLTFGFTDRQDGSALEYANLSRAIGNLLEGPWADPVARVNQVHSDLVVGPAKRGMCGTEPAFCLLGEGDAIVTFANGPAAAVFVADCAPVAIYDRELGVGAVVHAGWRGMAAGVVIRAAEMLAQQGCSNLEAVIAPHAGPCCYEFGEEQAVRLEQETGIAMTARTTWGSVSVDIFSALGAQLGEFGVKLIASRPACTICSDRYFSYRDGDALARQALVLIPSP